MKPYIFPITLYDAAFFATIFIGLTFALLLWFTKRTNQRANRFLALALGVVALWIARILAIDISLSTYILNWSWLPLRFSLALGPLLYFYVLKVTRPDYQFRRNDLLHFSPLLLEAGASILETVESIKKGFPTYDTLIFHQLSPVLYLAAFISVIIYLGLSYRLIKRFYQRQQFNNANDRYRHELRWLHNLLTGFGLLWLLWIPIIAIGYIFHDHYAGTQALYLLLVSMTIWMAARAYLRPETGMATDTPPILKRLPPAELKQKGAWLKQAIKENRYYENPELTLSSLAEKLGLTAHELSRIINTALKKNFNDFINEYRVAEVVRKMQDPAYDRITLLGIGYDSGFSSNSTFHRIFKEMTGKSPAEYKKELPSYDLGYRLRFANLISFQDAAPTWSREKLNRNYMFKNYFKIAFRNLWRNKAFSVINIVGLSVGLACCMLIFLYTMDEVSYDRFNINAANIYHLAADMKSLDGQIHKGSSTGDMPGPNFKRQLPDILDFVRIQGASYTVRRGTEVFDQDALYVDSNFFSVFTFPVIHGNPKTALNDTHSIVLSEEIAEKYFGKQDAVGKTLDLKVDDKFQPFK